MAFVGTDWPSHNALPPSFYCDASNWVKAVSNAFHSSRSAASIIHVPDSAPNSDFRNSSNTCAHLFFGLPLVRYPSSGIQVNRVVDQRLSSRRITWPAYVHLRRRCPCTQSSIFNVLQYMLRQTSAATQPLNPTLFLQSVIVLCA